jgi:hypothetical protein
VLQRFSWKRILLSAVLQFASLTGAPLRPKDIEDALRPRNEIVSEDQSRDDNDAAQPSLRR